MSNEEQNISTQLDNYLNELKETLTPKNRQSEKFNWENVKIDDFSMKEDVLETSFSLNQEQPFCFKITQYALYDTSIAFYENKSFLNLGDKDFGTPKFFTEFHGDIDIAKTIVENTVEHFNNKKDFTFVDIENHINSQIPYFFDWENAEDFSDINDSLSGEYLINGLFNNNEPSYFIVSPLNSNNSSIMFFRDKTDIMDHKAKVYVDSNLDIDSAKKIVEKTHEHFINIESYKLSDMKDYIIQQLPAQTIIIDQWPVTSQTTPLQIPVSDRQLETAQKTGYVQGVCESVLAFNNDENRKIMTEATITFLSKKLLSEMNVTKDMAQKFANPETYKALEKCVFTQNQEQQLEQTQSQGFKR